MTITAERIKKLAAVKELKPLDRSFVRRLLDKLAASKPLTGRDKFEFEEIEQEQMAKGNL